MLIRKVSKNPRSFPRIALLVAGSRAALVRVAAYNRRQMILTLGNHDR